MRYEIDDYQASGPHAMLLLSLLARMRVQRAPQLPTALHPLISELNEKAHDKKKVASKKIIRFDDYFASPYGSNVTQFRTAAEIATRFIGYLADAFMGDGLDEVVQVPPTVQSIRESFERPIDAFLSKLLIDSIRHSPHPDYSWEDGGTRYWVRGYSEASLKLTLAGISQHHKNEHPESGVFHVLREARGVFRSSTSNENRVTSLVREVLWLRDTASDNENGWKGCYFSAVDASVYVINRVEVISRGQLQLFGRKMLDSRRNDDAHFYLSVPCLNAGRQASPHRLGLLCGSTTRVVCPAAWKIAVLVPGSQSALSLALETIVQQPVYSAAGGDQAQIHNDLYEKLVIAHSYLHEKQELGVLAAHSLAVKNTEEQRRLSQLRLAFKQIVATDMPVIVDPVTTALFCDLLNQEARQALAELRGKKSSAEPVERLLANILHSWPLLEPLHLFAAVPASGPAGTAIDTLLAAKPSERDLKSLNSVE